jgi:hypothetical protein
MAKKDLVEIELKMPKEHAEFLAMLAKRAGLTRSQMVAAILALAVRHEPPEPQP